MTLNYFDWFLIAILAWSTIRAFLRGIFREIFALVGLGLGIMVACWYYDVLAMPLERLISTPAAAQGLAFFLIAFGIMIACALLGRLLQSTASAIGLGFIDRLQRVPTVNQSSIFHAFAVPILEDAIAFVFAGAPTGIFNGRPLFGSEEHLGARLLHEISGGVVAQRLFQCGHRLRCKKSRQAT